MSLGHDETLLEMFNAGLAKFGFVLLKFSCLWLDDRTIYLTSMNGIPFLSGLRERMHTFAYYVWVGDVRIKDPQDGAVICAHSVINSIKIHGRSHQDKIRYSWFEIQIKIDLNHISCYWIIILSSMILLVGDKHYNYIS